MKNSSAALARSITQSSSKQSYTIARLLADRDLVDDCLRAYAYFRWADDVIDISSQSAEERLAFIRGQRQLVNCLYEGQRPDDLSPEEEMLADLIAHDQGENSGLQSFIRCFVEVLEFDAGRKGGLINQDELTWYSHCLGKAVTDAIQYFIGNRHAYAESQCRYLAATAAHVTHMLRDMTEDLSEGFVNIPEEWLADHGFGCDTQDVSPSILDDPDFRDWVQSQVALARAYFREGKSYLDGLDVLRCKIAAYWYCTRFECVLDAIESDGYVLRRGYHERRKLSTKLKMGWLAVSITFRHCVHRGQRRSWDVKAHSGFEVAATEH